MAKKKLKIRRGNFTTVYETHVRLVKNIDKDAWYEFLNVCDDIGCSDEVMLNELIIQFNKEMRKAKEYNLKTPYGDIFPTSGEKK